MAYGLWLMAYGLWLMAYGNHIIPSFNIKSLFYLKYFETTQVVDS